MLRGMASISLLNSMAATSAFAQRPFPSKAIRCIIPYGAGSAVDVSSRNLATRLSSSWHQPVAVDNRPGANGIVALQATALSPADGYTVVSAAQATMTINPFVYEKVPYDPMRDFVPLGGLFKGPYVLVANSSLPIVSLAEFVEYARRSPHPVTFASYGVGSGSHIAAELFALMAGVKMTHVPYTANSIVGLLAGDVAISFEPIPVALSHLKAGRLRPFGVSGLEPSPSLPQVPPIAETVSAYEAVPWVALFSPAGTPMAIVDKFSAEISRIVALPDLANEFAAIGLVPWPASSAAVSDVLQADLEKHASLIRGLGIKA